VDFLHRQFFLHGPSFERFHFPCSIFLHFRSLRSCFLRGARSPSLFFVPLFLPFLFCTFIMLFHASSKHFVFLLLQPDGHLSSRILHVYRTSKAVRVLKHFVIFFAGKPIVPRHRVPETRRETTV
jgi:hypothetical protein